MLKKYISYFGILVFICFSFFYTDRAVDIVRRNDPIMKSIMSNKDNYNISSVNAIINDDEVIPGINGISVNIKESYNNMKKYNSYNEDMFIFREVLPEINLNDNYDKYIVSGNKSKNQVALVFKIKDLEYVDEINKILLNKNVVATFFIDGIVIDYNADSIMELVNNKNEIENLGYDNEYSLDKFFWTNNLIASLTKKDPKYCYTDYKVDSILELCSKYNMYTIIPNISVDNYPFLTVKKSLENGSIISFNLNSDTIKELPSIISYIKQKGYNLVLLSDLLSEKY